MRNSLRRLWHQSLDHNEILNVRWAIADPNSVSQAREAKQIEEQAAEADRAILPPESVAELGGGDLGARKKQKLDRTLALHDFQGLGDLRYTRKQYSADDESEMLEMSTKRSTIEPASLLDEPKKEDIRGKGILSSSTLATLNRRYGGVRAAKMKPPGSLVDYRSSDDST